ncbi:MAG: hypothetical protein Q9M43_12405 [Sulfurimonas sp.]|nr:hypothetical protein [Sulfurimonas sp.]
MSANDIALLEKEKRELEEKFAQEKEAASKLFKKKLAAIRAKENLIKTKSKKQLADKALLVLNGKMTLDELREFAIMNALIKDDSVKESETVEEDEVANVEETRIEGSRNEYL